MSPVSELPLGPAPKRLKRPRAAQACSFCRKRKVKCSGDHPCKYCQEVGVRCEFAHAAGSPSPRARSPTLEQTHVENTERSSLSHDLNVLSSATSPGESRRPSPEPQTLADGHHIGATSGVSLLYSALKKVDQTSILPGPLTSYGDLAESLVDSVTQSWQPTLEEITTLMNRYFTFATPTYRYLHRPTLEKWAAQLTSNHEPLSTPRKVCVLLACAQALLYTSHGDRYIEGGDDDVQKSRCLYERAKAALDHESGPATLASVQARLAMCLYLVSTFRMTECRFCFSLTTSILMSLGLHRKDPARTQLPLVELECRRRTFWCAYVLDGYLSVMLGRPRIIRDEDIDQPYPRNFDDQDLMSLEPDTTIPMHGNLEAFIGHADLAKLMARNSDLLYPIHQLGQEQILERTSTMIGALHKWRDTLPPFLRPREKTLTGQRTFERQNTVLKLAYAHACILATRRCLGIQDSSCSQTTGHVQQARDECIKSISAIVNASHDLLERGALYQAYWFTQYISVVAISTLYVLLIQDSRSSKARGNQQNSFTEENIQTLLEKAQRCHRRLAEIAPEGSQAYRHYRLLDQLRLQCKKALSRSGHQSTRKTQDRPPQIPQQSKSGRSQSNEQSIRPVRPSATPDFTGQFMSADQFNAPMVNFDVIGQLDGGFSFDFSDYSVTSPFSTSEEDLTFDSLMGWEWESLDTLGLPTYSMGTEAFEL